MNHKFSPYCKINNGRCPDCEKQLTTISNKDIKTLRPDSSECEEHQLIKLKAPESRTGQGSPLYIQALKELEHFKDIIKTQKRFWEQKDAQTSEQTKEVIKKLEEAEARPWSEIEKELYSEERIKANREAAKPLWQYVIIRKELKGGALLAQSGHAIGYAVSQYTMKYGPLKEHTRICVLSATKEQMAEIASKISQLESGVIKDSFYVFTECEGPLASSSTAMSFLTNDKDLARPITGGLSLWQ